jgi:hypothetical protein
MLCTSCHNDAVEHDALFQPWCSTCKKRLLLVNWWCNHSWLLSSVAQLEKLLPPTKDVMCQFVQHARDADVEQAWLHIARTTSAIEQSESAAHLFPPPASDTPYGGNIFWHPWEAQWANFFDALDIAYQYQREKTPTLLTPSSFWLPPFGAHLLVIGRHSLPYEWKRLEQARNFALTAGTIVYVLHGRTGPIETGTYTASRFNRDGTWRRELAWHECPKCQKIAFFSPLRPEERFCGCGQPYQSRSTRLSSAFLGARYARFLLAVPRQRI